MALTTKQEMTDEQRMENLLLGLSGPSQPVFINYSHLAQVLGVQQAEAFVESFTEMKEVVNPNTNPRSTVNYKEKRSGLIQVQSGPVREALLKVKEAKGKKKIDDKVQPPKP